MSSRNEELMKKWTAGADPAMPGIDVSVTPDPFAPKSDDDTEWQEIVAREQLTWGTDLTDTDDSAAED